MLNVFFSDREIAPLSQHKCNLKTRNIWNYPKVLLTSQHAEYYSNTLLHILLESAAINWASMVYVQSEVLLLPINSSA